MAPLKIPSPIRIILYAILAVFCLRAAHTGYYTYRIADGDPLFYAIAVAYPLAIALLIFFSFKNNYIKIFLSIILLCYGLFESVGVYFAITGGVYGFASMTALFALLNLSGAVLLFKYNNTST